MKEKDKDAKEVITKCLDNSNTNVSSITKISEKAIDIVTKQCKDALPLIECTEKNYNYKFKINKKAYKIRRVTN